MMRQPSKDIKEYDEDYEKVKELGRGKFGVVYQVKRQLSGENFAAKYVK